MFEKKIGIEYQVLPYAVQFNFYQIFTEVTTKYNRKFVITGVSLSLQPESNNFVFRANLRLKAN